MKEATEQLVRLSLDRCEGSVVEHELAHTERDVAIVRQPNSSLLAAQVHDHGPQLNAGCDPLLGEETRGELIALKLDPVAQDASELPPRGGGDQILPGGLSKGGLSEEFSLVFGAEATSDHARTPRQAKVVIEEDSLHACRLNPPYRRTVLLGGRRVQRGARVGGSVRSHCQPPVLRRCQWDIAGLGTEGIAGMAERHVDQVGRHTPSLDLLPPMGEELLQRRDPVPIEEAGEPYIGHTSVMGQIKQLRIGRGGYRAKSRGDSSAPVMGHPPRAQESSRQQHRLAPHFPRKLRRERDSLGMTGSWVEPDRPMWRDYARTLVSTFPATSVSR